MGDPLFDAQVFRTKQLLGDYGAWINRYRGGLPSGVMASWMRSESDGNFEAPGDPSLGEVGYYQVAEYVPALFGYSADARYDPESNVAIAALEYMLEAVLWKLEFPDIVVLGTGDSYRLARLSFAVGRYGSRALAAHAGALKPGDAYGSILAAVNARGGIDLGAGQPADKVAFRVRDVATQWAVGEAANGTRSGMPQLIPNPPAGPYAIPPNAAPYFTRPLPAIVIGAVAALGLLAFFLRRS